MTSALKSLQTATATMELLAQIRVFTVIKDVDSIIELVENGMTDAANEVLDAREAIAAFESDTAPASHEIPLPELEIIHKLWRFRDPVLGDPAYIAAVEFDEAREAMPLAA